MDGFLYSICYLFSGNFGGYLLPCYHYFSTPKLEPTVSGKSDSFSKLKITEHGKDTYLFLLDYLLQFWLQFVLFWYNLLMHWMLHFKILILIMLYSLSFMISVYSVYWVSIALNVSIFSFKISGSFTGVAVITYFGVMRPLFYRDRLTPKVMYWAAAGICIVSACISV